ncbi:hypothetical protein CHLRE_02g109950v5 [Chlamydomonas reinhardtii]|uniref:Lhc-like protein Lhl2 n=1 Tax=Chlamydomonas reinhardtii TaxID=3055 RepID=Q5W9T3_CHLRE|nr:uncharacterized protein CHLRE_02g109950v5 [Chlamydomonas reinhardtii]PNW87121.1 hypothetical protein CHLRE_02g109950v5 [Chlamydomonas reinhardtii]BAD67135.1 Lhc-like protein Lhl2 [Chlamydomonas reinhardtii]|eukprot:XP_001699943.1 single helix LHC light protein [Chlamydomonas reinhardtii]
MSTLSARAPFSCPSVSRRSGKVSTRFSRSTRAVVVRAAVVPAPKGISMPPKQPDVPPPKNGFVDYAERMNSRAAMIGFFALLAVEGIFGKGLLELVGITTGNGLGFEL